MTFDMTPNIFLEALSCQSLKFRNFVSDIFFLKGRSYNIEVPDLIPIEDAKDPYQFVEDSSFSRVVRFQQKITKISKENRQSGKQLKEVEFFTSAFPLKTSLSDKFMHTLLKKLDDTSDEVLLGNLSYLVKEVWERYRYLVFIYAMVHWIATIIFIYLVLKDNAVIIYVVILGVFITLLVFYEIIVMIGDPYKYITSVYNWVDVITSLSVFAIAVVLKPMGLINENN